MDEKTQRWTRSSAERGRAAAMAARFSQAERGQPFRASWASRQDHSMHLRKRR